MFVMKTGQKKAARPKENEALEKTFIVWSRKLIKR